MVSKNPLKEKTLAWKAGYSTGLEGPMERRLMFLTGSYEGCHSFALLNTAEASVIRLKERFPMEEDENLKVFKIRLYKCF